jgi:hypothetical protein
MALNAFFSIKVGMCAITNHGPINDFRLTSGTVLIGV